MKALVALFLVCSALTAQTSAKITLADGAVVQLARGETKTFAPKVTARLEDGYLWISNRGAPDAYGSSKWVPEPWFFKSVVVTAPGLQPQTTPFDGSSPGPLPGEWTIVGSWAKPYKHVTSSGATLPPYGPSVVHQMLDGGDSLYVRFVPTADPLELSPTPPGAASAALGLIDFDEALFARRPLLEATLGLYTVNSTLFDPNPPVRNFGWFLIPSYFVSRFTGWPIDLMSGWYGFGDVNLPGDGNSNCQYGHDAWFLARGVRNADPLARTVGLYLLERKCAFGLLDTDLPLSSCWVKGAWRGEKSGLGRRGILGPSSAKEWDLGLLLGLILRPDDPLFRRARDVRYARLTTVPPSTIWNGAGGGRQAGAYLRNLRDWYLSPGLTAAERDALKAAASRFVAHLWAVRDREAAKWDATNPSAPMRWFPNLSRPAITACWEEATLLAGLYWWAETEGVGVSRLADVDASATWYLERGTSWRGDPSKGLRQVAYELDVLTGVASYNSPMNGAWWAPLAPTIKRRMPGRFDATLDAMEATTFGNIGRIWQDVDLGRPAPTPSTLSVYQGSEQAGGFKMRAYAVLGARR